MTELTIYGQQTSTYEYVKMLLKRNAAKAHIELKLNEVNDWTEIIKDKVQSLPTIRVNSHINMSLVKGQDVNEFVQKVTSEILKEENFGDMLKIIVPTDFSNAATNALVYAHNLSKVMNGVIKVLHVYRPEVAQLDNVVVVDKHVEEAKKLQLENFVNKVNQSWYGASSDYIPMIGEFRVGFVLEEIEQITNQNDGNNLIVIGSTGSTGNVKKVFGSVSLQLSKNSSSPVLIVPPKTTYDSVDHILYAVNDYLMDAKVCEKLMEYAKNLDATIHLLHVKTDKNEYQHDLLIDRCKKIYPEVKLEYQEIEGKDVADDVNDYAVANKIDMISLTTTHRGFFSALFHKSVTRKLAIHSKIPTLVFHV